MNQLGYNLQKNPNTAYTSPDLAKFHPRLMLTSGLKRCNSLNSRVRLWRKICLLEACHTLIKHSGKSELTLSQLEHIAWTLLLEKEDPS